jgi:DNA-binding NarL/FixJ family response regulator
VDGGGGSGAADLERVRACFPRAGLVVLSDDDRYAAVARAAGQGARGYFSTSVDLRVLVQGIRLVLVGGTAMPVAVAAGPEPAAPIAREPSPGAAASGFSAGLFTPKELEVLRSLASGRPNKLIAHELAICETTVKVHLRHIFRKLGTTNRTHAALLAREMLDGAGA